MAITKEQKKTRVEDLASRFNDSTLAVLTDYRGLDVAAISELRKRLSEAGVSYLVVKNTLVKLALAKSTHKAIDTTIFTGPMAIAFGQDEAAAAKIIFEFAKDHETLELVGAINAAGELLDSKSVTALAKLPTRQELYGQLVGTIASPVAGLVRVLQANLTGILYALNAIKDQQSS